MTPHATYAYVDKADIKCNNAKYSLCFRFTLKQPNGSFDYEEEIMIGKKRKAAFEFNFAGMKNAVRDRAGRFTRANAVLILVAVIVAAVFFYWALPSINIFSEELYFFLIIVFALLFAASLRYPNRRQFFGVTKFTKALVIIFVVGVIVYAVGHLSSSKIFWAHRYASLITVEEKDFATDIVESNTVSDIAVMDTDSARVVGQRAIGSLSDVVSQYEISEDYTQIDLNGEPMKVASLEYADFFKWFNNRGEGIPGYVLVDPVDFEAEYVKLDKPIKYTPSGWFNDNLYRHLRFQYPTAIFYDYYFEIDEEGNPYYVCPVMGPCVSMFGGYDVKGVVVCDPCSGDSEYYELAEVPNWVDRVYDGDLIQQKYNWYGTLSGGFINSIIGQEGCKIATDDYGYKVMDGDVWIYTGVTSVNGDQSNIGFIMSNARTGETKYYSVAGAEEYSAMSAAEGQVQDLGYDASFPSLINVSGCPTYFTVLKDKSSLVKMYAMINVQKYSIVATGTTQKEVFAEYKKLLGQNNLLSSAEESYAELPSKSTLVRDVKFVLVDGETQVYVTDEDGIVYKQQFSENEELIFIEEGDSVIIYYEDTDSDIKEMLSYEFVKDTE